MLPLALLVDLGLADGDVEVHPDLGRGEPPAGVVAPEADRVVTRLVARERELALGHPARVDDLVAALDLLPRVLRVSISRSRAPGRGRTWTTIWIPSWSLMMYVLVASCHSSAL